MEEKELDKPNHIVAVSFEKRRMWPVDKADACAHARVTVIACRNDFLILFDIISEIIESL